MLLGNLYHKLIYQFKNVAIYPVFKMFVKDRLMHPFLSARKKKFKKKHKDFLKSKKLFTDYFSINAYVGAIRRANYVIENIPNSSENYRALKILESCYENLGYTELLEDIRVVININYPNQENTNAPRERRWSWNFLDNSKPQNN